MRKKPSYAHLQKFGMELVLLKNMKQLFLTILFLSCVLGGIAQTDTTKATVMVYRLRANFASAIKYSIFVDGEELHKIGNGRYETLSLPPGEHYFSTASNFRKDGVKWKVEAGKTYYLKFEIEQGLYSGRPHLVFVPEMTGQQELQKVRD